MNEIVGRHPVRAFWLEPCLLTLLVGRLILFASPGASAEIHRWTDSEGNVHITDDLPPKSVAPQTHALSPGKQPSKLPRPPETGGQQPSRFSRGLLWKVEPEGALSSGSPPGYLFGTIHVADPRVLNLPPEVSRAFDASATYCMELVPDIANTVELVQHMVYTDGRDLRSVIGKDLFERIVPRMAEHGVPEQALNLFKPWAVLMKLAMPPPTTGLPLDVFLYESAKQSGKSVCALETAEEQAAVLEQIPEADQIRMLGEALRHYDSVQKSVEQMIETYLARDLAGMLRLALEDTGKSTEESSVSEAFLKRILHDRNQRMAERLPARFKEGNVFVAVGAAHLPGESGILSILEAQGYRITAIY